MGYKRGALLLGWEDGSEFAGLEVRMRRLTIKQLIRLEELTDLRSSDDSAEVVAAMTELTDIIGKGLLGWNLEDEGTGEPVPATREALDGIDLDMTLAILRAWRRAAADVPLASPPSSLTGEPVPPDEEWASYLEQSQENLPAPA
jgi:hypothetical protein